MTSKIEWAGRSSGNQKNVPLSNGFILDQDGLSAVKTLVLEIKGEKKNVEYRIFFDAKSMSEASKIKLLNNLAPEKIETLAKEAVSLGLGDKFQSIAITPSQAGIKKLDLYRFDGSIKTYDMDYFNKKEIEIKRLNDSEKTERFEKKLKLYKSIEKISHSLSPLQEEVQVHTQRKNIKKSLSEAEKNVREFEQDPVMKSLYIGDKPVLDIIKEHLSSHKNLTKEQVRKYLSENIFNHPDLRKKT